MVENRWQIAIGALVLLLMLLAGVFSLGVYIGRHGLSREVFRYQPAQITNQQGLQQAIRPAGIPEGDPQLIGRLRLVTRQGIELATQDGVRFVAINQETKLLNGRGETLQRSNFQTGDILAIFGDFSLNEGKQLLAEVIVRLPVQQPPQP